MKWSLEPARGRALLTGALIAAASCRLAWIVVEARASFDREYYCGGSMDRNVEAGHALLHGLPHDAVFWSMPAGTVANALMCRQTSPGLLLAAPAAAFLLGGLLVFGLGELLAGGLAGACALTVFAWSAEWGQAYGDRWLFTLSLILTAYLAVWRARFPSPRKTALLAAAIGLSLGVLSVLFLLPALLAADAWRRRRLDAGLLLLVPFLLLLPWAAANRRVTGSLTFLESGRSDTNVITGALGLVRTVGPGSSRELAGIPFGSSAAAWAVKEVARHPARYLAAVARRLRFAASLRPLLLIAALLALWLFRRRPGHAALGAVVLYHLLIHSLMPVEERYFVPLWPLAAALAASLAGLGRGEPEGRPWSGALAACAFLPFAGLTAYAQALVLAYPSRSADPAAWEREAARGPERAWLLGETGKRLLRAGRPGEAAAALTRSLRLEPLRERAQLLEWTRIVRGERRPPRPDDGGGIRPLVMRAMADLRAGRTKDAARNMARARELQSRLSASWGGGAPAATDDTLRSAARELLQYWPLRDRVVILAGLERMPGLAGAVPSGAAPAPGAALAANAPPAAPPRTALEEAREALRRAAKPGAPRADALRLLAEAEAYAPSDAGIVRRVAEEHARLGAPGLGLDALRRLAARRPRDLDLRVDLALRAGGIGRSADARAALDEALRLCARAPDLRRVADAYREIGEPREAARLLRRLTADRTNADADGDRADLARLLTTMKEYDGSLRLFDELLRRDPGNARWRDDRAVVLALLDREAQAYRERARSAAKP